MLSSAIFNVTEPESQRYFSELFGTIPVWNKNASFQYTAEGEIEMCGFGVSEGREPFIYPHEFAMNNDILLHTPYGICRSIKMTMEEIMRAKSSSFGRKQFHISEDEMREVVDQIAENNAHSKKGFCKSIFQTLL